MTTTSDGPLADLFAYARQTVGYTLAFQVVAGAIASPVLWAAVRIGPQSGLLGLAALVGFSLYYVQVTALGDAASIDMDAVSRPVRVALVVLNVFYYNAIIAAAWVVAALTFGAEMRAVAVAVAAGYPQLDVFLARRNVPLSVSGLFSLAALTILMLAELIETVRGHELPSDAIGALLFGGTDPPHSAGPRRQ